MSWLSKKVKKIGKKLETGAKKLGGQLVGAAVGAVAGGGGIGAAFGATKAMVQEKIQGAVASSLTAAQSIASPVQSGLLGNLSPTFFQGAGTVAGVVGTTAAGGVANLLTGGLGGSKVSGLVSSILPQPALPAAAVQGGGSMANINWAQILGGAAAGAAGMMGGRAGAAAPNLGQQLAAVAGGIATGVVGGRMTRVQRLQQAVQIAAPLTGSAQTRVIGALMRGRRHGISATELRGYRKISRLLMSLPLAARPRASRGRKR